ncbi:MAG: pilus assembly protein PilC [Micrococcales bacterium]|nr:MAG: pilus assembly protein PilC [Micrococcales bacterium]PIE26746.1 MAG: pilus assembly protein PilC [Micrococcales bacterium]
MPTATKTFAYTVRDRSGKVVNGQVDAASQSAAVNKLKGQGLAPISVNEAGTGMNRELSLPGSNRVGLKDIAIMSRQFATMINSGLTLLRALNILADQSENAGLRKALTDVRNQVEAGTSLSAALASHEKVFPPLMVNMCRAGEVGGFLDQALLQVADNFEAEVKLRSKIKAAMTYPVAVLVIAIACVIGMLKWIVPTFENLFTSLGGELPAPTQVLVFLSKQMTWFLPVFLVLTVVGVVVWSQVRHQDNVRSVVDPVKLKTPVFGPLFQKVALSRFARNLGSMIRSGVPILQALEIVGETTGNIVIEKALFDVRDSVRQGESLAGPLEQHPVFPPMVVQMLAVGEDTGALDTMLHKLSDFYDNEVEATTEALTALMEPLMIAVLGSIVGGMIIALYMPIFRIFDLIK